MNRRTANNDHTVLSLASAGGHVSVVQYLLMKGAEPSHLLRVSQGFICMLHDHTKTLLERLSKKEESIPSHQVSSTSWRICREILPVN